MQGINTDFGFAIYDKNEELTSIYNSIFKKENEEDLITHILCLPIVKNEPFIPLLWFFEQITLWHKTTFLCCSGWGFHYWLF